MTKKDYELIAKTIGAKQSFRIVTVVDEAFHDGILSVAHALADALATDNPRFDRIRFLKVCGVDL